MLAADCVFWPALFVPLLRTLTSLHAAAAHLPTPPAGATAFAGAARGPRFLLTVTERLGRAEVFRAQATAEGWVLEELRCGVSFPHTRLYEARRET